MSDIRLIFFTTGLGKNNTSEVGYYEFDKQGGTIGSAHDDTWCLGRDSFHIKKYHVTVGFTQGLYFIEENSSSVIINESNTPVGQNKKAELVHGSTISLGGVTIKVIVTSDSLSTVELIKKHSNSLNSLIDEDVSNDILLLPTIASNDHPECFKNTYQDIMAYQPISNKVGENLDPLVALDNTESIATNVNLNSTAKSTEQNNPEIFSTEQSSGLDNAFNEAPLHLTPREELENELSRLTDGSTESSPSIVKQTNDYRLTNARENELLEALKGLMYALSPDILVKEFERYSTNKGDYASNDEWSWSMYKKYYSELMTDKQNGFDRLFKELYTQSYDKKIRSLQTPERDL